ncbi:MAG: hypothetical protein QXW37_08475 [Candidatus Nitrosotenuis sp.]
MARTRLCRLIDKNQLSPTGIVEGGLVDGDLNPYFMMCEFEHTSVAKVSNIVLKLAIPKDGKFVRTAPILVDQFAKDKYLVEYQITQDGNQGLLFRGEIGEPSIVNDPLLGEILSIPCEAIERNTREDFQSVRGVLKTPKRRFIQIIDSFNAMPRPDVIGYLGGNKETAVDLPDEPLRQFWEPFGPTKTKDLLNEVITRLEQAPQAGGTLRDYYYDFVPNPTTTRYTDVFAEEFGKTSSGLVIDPLKVTPAGTEEEKRISFDNIIYKNYVIAKGHPNSGSLPLEHSIARSSFLHAVARPIWKNSVTYSKGDAVKRQFPGSFPDERFFVSLQDSNLNHTPELSPSWWSEDFSIDPNNSSAFMSFNPWYQEISSIPTVSRSHMVGQGNAIFNGGRDADGYTNGTTPYRGFFFDWNIERTNYDRTISQDHWQRISVKSVIKRSNIPPLKSELYDGYRIILGTYLAPDSSIGRGAEGMYKTVNGFDAFVPANRGKILEYNGDPDGLQGNGTHPKDTEANGWILSDEPGDTGSGSNRTQDMVNDLDTAKTLVWDKTAGDQTRVVKGEWVDAWDIAVNFGNSSPFHLVKSIQTVTGATGIPNSAFEATFNWIDKTTPPFGDPIAGDEKNKNSRGLWLSFIFPYPRSQINGKPTGAFYGKNRAWPYLDTFNLDRASDGTVGWNQGLKSAELGRISGMHFKLRTSFFSSSDDSKLSVGISNIPMVFWVMDKFGRVYFQEFVQRVNNAWEDHTITFGPRSPQNYFFSRFDELAEFWGYKLPFNFFLREREYTGVQFDWRFVKYVGIFSKIMYEENAGHYLGTFEQSFKGFWLNLEQATQNFLKFIGERVQGQVPTAKLTDSKVDHAKIAIDEFYFVKELYAMSDDLPPQPVLTNAPRVHLERVEAEQDYLTLQAKAKAVKARRQFFPQFWHIIARGDPRMKLGKKFTIQGPYVPGGGPIELVCAEVKHIDTADGYTMEFLGVRKFLA